MSLTFHSKHLSASIRLYFVKYLRQADEQKEGTRHRTHRTHIHIPEKRSRKNEEKKKPRQPSTVWNCFEQRFFTSSFFFFLLFSLFHQLFQRDSRTTAISNDMARKNTADFYFFSFHLLYRLAFNIKIPIIRYKA